MLRLEDYGLILSDDEERRVMRAMTMDPPEPFDPTREYEEDPDHPFFAACHIPGCNGRWFVFSVPAATGRLYSACSGCCRWFSVRIGKESMDDLLRNPPSSYYIEEAPRERKVVEMANERLRLV